MRVRMERVYDEPDSEEEVRLLVDRLWPRGLRRDDPRVGDWHPEVAPSSELRRWYGHRPERYEEFAARYEQELAEPEAVERLAALARMAETVPLVLVTASRDVERSHVPVLARVLTD